MARKNNGWLIALGLGAGVAILARSSGAKAAKMSKLYKAPMALTRNFDLAEFTKGLGDYSLNQDQFDNVSRLARLLQKGRDFLGAPIVITSGGRPTDWRAPKGYTINGKDMSGKSLEEILKLQGYHPSPTSDHHWWGAADTVYSEPENFAKAAVFFANQPETRQVILEYRFTKPTDGNPAMPVPMAVHVAVIGPGKPKLKGDTYAFVTVDGKRDKNLQWQQPLPNV